VQVYVPKWEVVGKGIAVVNPYWCGCHNWVAAVESSCCEEPTASAGDASDFPGGVGEVIDILRERGGILGKGWEGGDSLSDGRCCKERYPSPIGKFVIRIDAVGFGDIGYTFGLLGPKARSGDWFGPAAFELRMPSHLRECQQIVSFGCTAEAI